LIQLLEKRGNEYQTRHIIMTPKPSEDDFEKAAKILEDLRNKILTDSIRFEQAAQLVSDDESTKVNGGFYADQFGSLRIPAKSLDPELFFLIDKMQEGDISEPQTVLVGESKVARIIYYKKRMPPHRANLTDDYEKLKAATTQMKKSLKRAEYLEEKMQEVYLELDPVFNRCGIIKNQ